MVSRLKVVLVIAAAFLAQTRPVTGATTSPDRGTMLSQLDVATAVDRVKPSLVKIEVIATQHGQGREVKTESSGSGVIITRQGHIITNHHVAGKAVRLNCILSNNEEIEADLVGTDPLTDIAVIKLRVGPDRAFPTVAFGHSDKIAVGQPVLAMGSPLAMSQSVTRGIVSNTKMTFPRYVPELRMEGENVGALVRWIMHDAVIFPGNSGGPLVNLDGEIIGINEIGFGLSGAIPGNLAQDVARQIIDTGIVNRSWIGIEVQPLLQSSAKTQGVLVSTIIEDSPAASAGLQAGDLLTSIDGQPVNIHHVEQLPLFNQLVAAIPVGKTVAVQVLRQDRPLSLKLTTIQREPARGDQVELKHWGITASNISIAISKELRLASRDGILVTSIQPSGPSGDAKPSLQAGDIIRSVQSQPVANIEALRVLTASLPVKDGETVPVLVGFDRKREQLVTVVRVGIKQPNNVGRESRKAWLPIAIQAVSRDLAQALGAADLAGVRVTQIMPDTAAAQSGLAVGDIIVAVDNDPVQALRPGDEELFWAKLRALPVDSKPEFKVLRGTNTLTLTPELVRAPVPEREQDRYEDPNFEFAARDLSFFDQMREGWNNDQAGVLVTEVKPGGWAAIGKLSPNDIIVEANYKPVANVGSLKTVFKTIESEKPATVVLRVLRGVHGRFVEIEPTWDQPGSTQPQTASPEN
jgi:serine protease Do